MWREEERSDEWMEDEVEEEEGCLLLVCGDEGESRHGQANMSGQLNQNMRGHGKGEQERNC